jgi:hypothetical protein
MPAVIPDIPAPTTRTYTSAFSEYDEPLSEVYCQPHGLRVEMVDWEESTRVHGKS